MKVLVTGANGFVARNLIAHFAERADVEVLAFTREHTVSELADMVSRADFIFHLAGVNRPDDPDDRPAQAQGRAAAGSCGVYLVHSGRA